MFVLPEWCLLLVRSGGIGSQIVLDLAKAGANVLFVRLVSDRRKRLLVSRSIYTELCVPFFKKQGRRSHQAGARAQQWSQGTHGSSRRVRLVITWSARLHLTECSCVAAAAQRQLVKTSSRQRRLTSAMTSRCTSWFKTRVSATTPSCRTSLWRTTKSR